MAEEEPRVQKVLRYLEGVKENGLIRPKTIGDAIGENPKTIGKDLHDLKQRGLAVAEEEGLWKITPEGTESIIEADKRKEDSISEPKPEPNRTEPKPEPKTELKGAVPSQADILRSIGESLGVGAKKGVGVPLDSIIYYVERTANFNDLTSIWNRLSEMDVSNPVKKRWITLYSQSLPGKEIPEELREKLEIGQEGDKMSVTEKGEIPSKPKRFSIVGDQIIGDPEGDFTFKEALQLYAQQKGVPAAEADPLAGIVEAMKVGPEMATTVLTSLIPVIQKQSTAQADPLAGVVEAMKVGPEIATTVLTSLIPLIQKQSTGKDDNILLQILQSNQESSRAQIETLRTMILTLTEDKHKAEMESLRAEIRTGQRPPESDARIEALSAQVRELTESLHQKEIDSVKEQNQRIVETLQGDVRRLEQQISAVAQGKKLDGSLGLMEKALDTVSGQLTGIRTDVKPLVETIIKSGAPPIPPRSSEEKKKLAQVGKEVIAKATRAEELEHKIIGA